MWCYYIFNESIIHQHDSSDGPCVPKMCLEIWRQSIFFIAKQVRLILFVFYSKIQELIKKYTKTKIV